MSYQNYQGMPQPQYNAGAGGGDNFGGQQQEKYGGSVFGAAVPKSELSNPQGEIPVCR